MFYFFRPTNRSPTAKLTHTIDINFCGTERILRLLYPLANHGSRIVAVSSIFSLRCMLNLNANPNKRDGLNYAETVGNKLFSTNGFICAPEELCEIAEKFKTDYTEVSF